MRVYKPAADESSAPGCELAAGVLFLTAPDGTGRLLHLDGGVFGLSEEAAVLLSESLEHAPETAVLRLSNRFDVELSQLRQDLDDLLEQLETAGLINRRRNAAPCKRWEHSVRRAIMTLAFHLIDVCPCSGSWRARFIMLATRCGTRLAGFGTTIAACQRATRAGRKPSAQTNPNSAANYIARLIRDTASRSMFSVGCKERAVCAYVLAAHYGLPAEVVLGVDLYPFRTHCWCTSDGRILSDAAENCASYDPVACLTRRPADSAHPEGVS